jgi:GAF domain-containing protein
MNWRGQLDRGVKFYIALGGVIVTTGLLIGGGGWLAHRLGHHQHVRLWILVAAVLAAGIGGFLVSALLHAVLARGPAGSKVAAGPSARERELEARIAESEYQKRLVTDVLGSIQQGIAREDDWELDDLVERGVLDTARGLLIRSHGEDVRMAVLFPREDQPDRWKMRWATGHRPESVRSYDREIDSTMAGLAYRRGDDVVCDDVRQDDRFRAHPRETRPFHSLVAVPLVVGEERVGALSVVSTRVGAFREPDISFIKQIGAIIDLLLADEKDVHRIEEEARREAMRAAGGGNVGAGGEAPPAQEMPVNE